MRPTRNLSTLDLKIRGRHFVKHKVDLHKRLGLFQDDLTLFGYETYEVQSEVPWDDFAEFLYFVDGDPVTVSESTYESFSLLAKEFRFKELSDACKAFAASRERNRKPSAIVKLPERASPGPIEERPRVTITLGNRCVTYGFLNSISTLDAFLNDMERANEETIKIEGMERREDAVQDAVEAVYSNTVARLEDSDITKGFLALVLTRFFERLFRYSFNAGYYSLKELGAIVPTPLERARLYLLSQCSIDSNGEVVRNPTVDWTIIIRAKILLELAKSRKGKEYEEENVRREEAEELLRKLKGTGDISPTSMVP
jgi:hypothetical protein